MLFLCSMLLIINASVAEIENQSALYSKDEMVNFSKQVHEVKIDRTQSLKNNQKIIVEKWKIALSSN